MVSLLSPNCTPSVFFSFAFFLFLLLPCLSVRLPACLRVRVRVRVRVCVCVSVCVLIPSQQYIKRPPHPGPHPVFRGRLPHPPARPLLSECSPVLQLPLLYTILLV
jgi:hypothetical protein